MDRKKKRVERVALGLLLGGLTIFALMLWYAIGYGVDAGWTSSYHQDKKVDVGLTLQLASGRGVLSIVRFDSRSKLPLSSHRPHVYVKYKRTKAHIEFYRSDPNQTNTGSLLAIASSGGYAKLDIQFMHPQELGTPTHLVFNRIMPS